MRAAVQDQVRALSPWNRSDTETAAMLRRPRRWTLFWSGSILQRTERYALWHHHGKRERYRILVTSPGVTSAHNSHDRLHKGNSSRYGGGVGGIGDTGGRGGVGIACAGCCAGSPRPSAAFERHSRPAMMAQSDFCAVGDAPPYPTTQHTVSRN